MLYRNKRYEDNVMLNVEKRINGNKFKAQMSGLDYAYSILSQNKLSVMVHAYTYSIWEVEAGESTSLRLVWLAL